MALFTITPPGAFTFSQPDNWSRWIRRFERFRQASGLQSKSQESQINTLIYTMGDQADDILLSFQLSEEDKKKYDIVLTKFQGHFVKRRNVIYERMKFNQRIQQEGESVESFVTDLYALSETCNYGELTNEMIRDRIVVGIRDDSVAERLQIDHELTLDKVISIARQGETLKKQQPTVRMQQQQEVVSVEPVDAKKRPPTKKNFNSVPRSPRQSDAKKTHQCSRCGRSPPHPKTQCPAREAVCRKCSKKDIFRLCVAQGKLWEQLKEGRMTYFLEQCMLVQTQSA